MSDEKPKEPIEQPQEQPKPHEHKHEKIHKLENEIHKLKAEKEDIFGRLQRVSADFDNYQKRSAKQVSETINYEKELIIKSLFPILDNFDHTLTNAANLTNSEDLLKGVKIIYDQFIAILKTHGVEQIESVGKKFNPVCHQALTQKSENDKEDGIVLEEFRKGYKIGDKVLRPAIVIVNKKQKEEPKKTEDEKKEQ
jgi:molecular chaperone GrpE